MTSPNSTPLPSLPNVSASRLGFSARFRNHIAAEAKRDGASNTLHVTASSNWWSVNKRFQRSGLPGTSFEIDMHDQWFKYFHASINIPAADPAMDRLVLQIVQTKEMGALSRLKKRDAEVDGDAEGDGEAMEEEVAETGAGVIWKDLPYFVDDMAKFWMDNCASLSTTQRVSFSNFLAKVATTGVDDRICGIALVVLRDTLETARDIGTSADETQDEDSNRSTEDLSLLALLPAAIVWLTIAGWKMITLSEQSYDNLPTAQAYPGPLIPTDSTSSPPSNGFSIHRWLFWLTRLEQIKIQAESATDEYATKAITKALDIMIYRVEQRESRVRTAVNAGNGAVKHRPEIKRVGAGASGGVVHQALGEY